MVSEITVYNPVTQKREVEIRDEKTGELAVDRKTGRPKYNVFYENLRHIVEKWVPMVLKVPNSAQVN